MTVRSRVNTVVMTTGVLVIAAGCAGVSARVQAVPAKAQSEAVSTADAFACRIAAREKGGNETERELNFAACMIAREYRVTVPLRVGLNHALLDVVTVAPRAPERIPGDLVACQGAAAASGGAGPSAGEIAAGRLGGIVTPQGDPLGVRRHTERSNELETRLSACLSDRGYKVTSWEPSR